MLSRACLVVVLAACSSKNESPPPAPPPPPVIADAGVDGITTIVGFDPASGMHLDDDIGSAKPATRKPKGPSVAIGILLKSEPPGATVFVDGENLGPTPKYWPTQADGTEHEFAFTKPNYALARYRFVPITSGVLHAKLERVSSGGPPDAGLEPIIAPTFAPDASVAPPPPTVLTPLDAARAPAPPTAPADRPPAPDRAAPSESPPPAPPGNANDTGPTGPMP